MSIQEQRKRLQPLLAIAEDVNGLDEKELGRQEEMSAVIVEELLQNESIHAMNSPSALRLIIYEIVLWLAQPYKASVIDPQEEEAFVDQLEALLFKKENQINVLNS